MRARRSLATAITLAATLGAAPAVAHAATDTTPPVITAASVTPTKVDVTSAEQTVTVSVAATDETELRFLSAQVNDGRGEHGWRGTKLAPGAVEGTFTTSFTFVPGAGSGIRPVQIEVKDVAGNVTRQIIDVDVVSGPRDWVAPTVTCLSTPRTADTTWGPASVSATVRMTDPAGPAGHQPRAPFFQWTTRTLTPTTMDASVTGSLAQGSPIGAMPLLLLAGDRLDNQRGAQCPLADVRARIDGTDRYATAAAASRLEKGPVDTVYVASGENYPDAVSGAAAADGDGGVLLTRRSVLPTVTADALTRLDPRRVVVLGGSASVDDAVLARLRSYAPVVERISGADRYAVAAAVARRAATGGVVFLAAGDRWADALAAAANRPARASVMLAHPLTPTAPTLGALTALRPTKVVLVGSGWPAGYASTVQGAANAPVATVEGADRYAVAAQLYPRPAKPTAFVVSGAAWADALAIASHADGRTVYFAAPTVLPAATREAMAHDGATTGIVAVGGQAALTDTVQRQAVDAGGWG